MAGSKPSHAKKSARRRVGRGTSGRVEDGLSEYERQRVSRIRENQARVEALGLRNLASALRGTSGPVEQGQATGETKTDGRILDREKRGKNDDDVDDDYQPSEEDEGGERFLSSEEEAEEEGQTTKRKKKIFTNVKDRNELDIPLKRNQNDLDGVDDDADLLQAIALSLEEPRQPEENKPSRASSGASTSRGRHGEKENFVLMQHLMGRGEKGFRPQMTKDELVAYFFSFDEGGSGNVRLRDLMRVASAHDFRWTDEEMADMIHLFDSNGDDKLSLDDFSKIVSRCNMLKDS
ncbi:unnamed protein product [Spirodela intermedia]|uniref:EF-hand domain-containing protein n=1 Tax=Spirodela intermedia TaxID=51605 RepID=A0A7I8IGD4_SPIIN|nr:unnamed protein product [Spirodela intermedia]CAA6656133.1 unnamed protein product [Spirodela intermedia]